MAIKGYVDGVVDGSVVGWAHDPDHPGQRIELNVTLDGDPAGRCVADLRREDLVRAGIGDGRHGFRHPLIRPLQPGQHWIHVHAPGEPATLPLAEDYLADRPSVTLTTAPAPAPALAPSAAPGPEPLRGAAGWLFVHSTTERLHRAVGRQPASPERLREQVGLLQARHEHLAAVGAEYVLVTVPDKATVYAEHLPRELVPVPGRRPAADLARGLRSAPHLRPLDLLEPLRDARGHGRVFARTGAELTWLGAFHAYRAIAKELAARRLTGAPHPVDWLALDDLEPAGDGTERAPGLDRRPFTGGRPELPAAVVLHDGSGERLAPFLAEHFSRTIVRATVGLSLTPDEQASGTVVVQILSDGGPFYD